MSIGAAFHVRCDRCGVDFGLPFPDLHTAEKALRDAGWIPDRQAFTTAGGEQDALQVCHACRDAVENGAEP